MRKVKISEGRDEGSVSWPGKVANVCTFENQSGVAFQMLTLSILSCALGGGGAGSSMEKTLNRAGSRRAVGVLGLCGGVLLAGKGLQGWLL